MANASRACRTSRATSRSGRRSNAALSALASGSRTDGDHAGSIPIDIAEAQTAEGKPLLFAGIDRTRKFAVTQLVEKADRKTAREVLQHMLEAVPYQIHTVLTDRAIGTPLV